MTPRRRVDCRYEADVVDAIRASRWPAKADADLRAHVETCAICRDVADVAALVLAASDAPAGRDQAALPEAGAVWLRAQWRARAEAERTATHPITAAQAVGIAGGAAVVGAVVGATSGVLQSAVASVGAGLADWWTHTSVPSALVSTLAAHLTVAIVASFAVVAIPVAAYFATRD